jgi:hypothetical protein
LRSLVPNGHLAAPTLADQSAEVAEELSEREMLEAILGSAQYAHVKLDQILYLLGEDGEAEEDETDG